MAYLSETATFDAGVYQLELTDPVVGGPDGVSNSPLKNLANRTKYLKQHLDALEAGTTIPSTVAPLASPTFTGDPKGPTAAAGDNDTSLATTAFVQLAVGGYLSISVAGGSNVTLTAVQAGRGIIELTGALTANIAVIVPTSPTRSWVITNSTTGAYTLTVRTAAGAGVVVDAGVSCVLFCNGTNVMPAGVIAANNLAMTGTPTTPTAATDTATTQVASTAFVIGQAGTATPLVAGTGAAGTSYRFARQDHVHPAQTSVSGNAGTATKLATARTIAGVSFDGSANISIPFANLTSKPTTLGGYGITDAMANNAAATNSVSLSAPVFYDSVTPANYMDPGGTSNIVGLTVANTITGSVSGNAGTATKLATARTIAGVSFDGSANISIPFANLTSKPTTLGGYGITDAMANNAAATNSVSLSAPIFYDSANSAYYVDPASISNLSGLTVANTISGSVSGNAGTATKLATSRTIALTGDVTGSAEFDGSASISITATVGNDSHTHSFANLTGKPTTLAGFGITDAVQSAGGVSTDVSSANLNTLTATGFYRGSALVNAPDTGWFWVLVESHDNTGGAAGWTKQTLTAFGTTGIPAGTTYVRVQNGGTAWTSWSMVVSASNYNDYAPTKTGGGASGSWGISVTGSSASCTGNAATATTLQTTRAINGTNFNGSAAITTANWGTERTITIGSSGKSVNGSANVSWTLAEMGAAPLYSAALTGTPTAPTATAGDNTTQIATTAFVKTAVASAVSTSATLSAVAGASAGGVGTYAFLISTASGTEYTAGQTRAGSGLCYTNAYGYNSTTSSPSGTWRLMGQISGSGGNPGYASLWLRIS